MKTRVLASLIVAGCHGASRPPTAVGNRGSGGHEPTCPPVASPFAPEPASRPDDECLHGESISLFATATADPPTCHQFVVTGATAAIESLRLPGGRQIWIHQSGCVHVAIAVRGQLARSVPHDRAAQIAAAASLLRDLDPFTGDLGFEHFASELDDAAAARPETSFPLGAGDWTATVVVIDDRTLEIGLDFPL